MFFQLSIDCHEGLLALFQLAAGFCHVGGSLFDGIKDVINTLIELSGVDSLGHLFIDELV